MADSLEERLVARFLRYVAIASQNEATATVLPGQRRLAEMLAPELAEIGAADVQLDAPGILTARLPGTVPAAPRIGFVTHLC